MAIYSLNLRSIGRSTHAPGTAGAHVGYVTRAGACRAVVAENMPMPEIGARGGEARTWLDAQEQADRKNARVADKLMLALPRELDAVQRVELVRAFVRDLTGGRAVPWLAAFHDLEADADNPHCHLLLRDRDPETGRRVIGMSQRGAADRVRLAWEKTTNAALEAAGSDARIDRRSLLAQGAGRDPARHEGSAAQQIEAKGGRSTKLERIETGMKPRLEAMKAAREDRRAERAQKAALERKRAEASRDSRERKEAAQRTAQRRREAREVEKAEAERREVAHLAPLGRALLERDRARVTLAERHRIALLGPEWAAIEDPPRPFDLDRAARWVAQGRATRPADDLWAAPAPFQLAEFKEALVRAWRWVVGLGARSDPDADQAAAAWAGFHERNPALLDEWRELVERDARAAFEAGYRHSEPDPPRARPRPIGPSFGMG